MLAHIAVTALKASDASRKVSHWFLQLGGIGLLPLGLLDSSVIPIPGSMDIVTIVLAAHDSELWPYYAFMATIGSVIGGYTTYRLAEVHGRERLAERMPKRKLKWYTNVFKRWGFGAIVIPAILPPPMPMVPFLLAAGVAKYSLKEFLAAFTLGRAARFTILAYLGARYGHHIVRIFSEYGYKILYGVIALVSAGVVVMLVRKYVGKSQAQA